MGRWTDEQKAASSARHKIRWADKKAKDSQAVAPAVAVTPTGQNLQSNLSSTSDMKVKIVSRDTFDPWELMTFAEANLKLHMLDKEIAHARSVLNRRQQIETVMHKCWSALHHEDTTIVAKSVYAQCRKNIPDGKWLFRDDSPKDHETGLCSPVMVCSMACYMSYMAQRTVMGLSRK